MSMPSAGREFPRRSLWVGLLLISPLLGLPGCQTSPPPVPAPPGMPTPQAVVPANARQYTVVAEESLLQILVYRGGPMARLGHNHVIASHHLAGEVHLADDAAASRFEIRVPVNELTVDEPAMREQAGADFPANVPQAARDGTRRNMLSEALLDGARYPTLRLRATGVLVVGDGYDVGIEIALKDQLRQVRVPVRLERRDGGLVASGEFALKQSDLGLKPFSVAMGSLVVLDEMKIRFEITAR
jgi:polyisoprenoid-binding protein YceI